MNRLAIATLLLALLLAPACKSGKPLPLIHRELPARSPDKLLERMLLSDTARFTHYSAKASITIKLPDESRSFKAQIRSVTDSALWVSVVPALGIEVARVLITPDSLKLMDKMSDQYFIGDTAAARERFKLQPSLSLLQNALLGKPLGVDLAEKYRSDREDGHYVLTSRAPRRFVRAAEDISPADTLDRNRDMGERRLERTLRKAEEKGSIVFRYWIDPDNFRVTRVQLTDLAHDQGADLRYESRGGPEEGHLPTRISITLHEPGRVGTGTLELSRISTVGPLPMNFKIPEKYVPMP
jgi:hypothetical protein